MLAKPIIILLQAYKLVISPFTSGGCRFQPTCSEYAKDAFEQKGVFIGLYLTVCRLVKCNPWGGSGYDPVTPTSSLKKSAQFDCCNKQHSGTH